MNEENDILVQLTGYGRTLTGIHDDQDDCRNVLGTFLDFMRGIGYQDGSILDALEHYKEEFASIWDGRNNNGEQSEERTEETAESEL